MKPPVDLHIVGDDPPLRLLRRLRLVPGDGLGVARRAVIAALLAWLPLAVLATLEGKVGPAHPGGENLFSHFAVHTQCLLAIPLFVLGEALARYTGESLGRSLEGNELVRGEELEKLKRIIAQHVFLRQSLGPWILLLTLALSWTVSSARAFQADATLFGLHEAPGPELSMSGFWYLYVSRTIFALLLLAWLWRLLMWAMFLVRFARLKLELVPTHPDRAMGLGFFARTATVFSPFVFGLSSVLAAEWAHRIVYHGADLMHFRVPLAVFAAVMSLLILGPMLVLSVPLALARQQALVDYGILVTRHDRLVYERWIQNREVGEDPVLNAPELGPVADVGTLFAAIRDTRLVPIGRITVLAVLLPIAVPMLIVTLIEMPIAELLKRLASMVL